MSVIRFQTNVPVSVHLRSEVFSDVHEEVGYRSYYEVWTCRDCGARIDEDGEVINRRAA